MVATHAIRTTLRPRAQASDYKSRSGFRAAGIGIALLGLMLAMAALIANAVVAGDSPAERADTLAGSFGIGVTGLAIAKLGIAATLVGILVRLWLRVESVKAAVPELKAPAAGGVEAYGKVNTPYGAATATERAPKPLLIHRMSEVLWLPMVLMGPMLVGAGLVLSIVQSNETSAATAQDLGAWVQGTQFLGEALLLGGISFLLGTILSSLRRGGGEVQESVGVTVKTLKMPASAKAFVGLMAAGMMVAMAQFGLYVAAASQGDATSWFAWLGPVREFGLGLLLLGIVLALYTIGTVLGFQFDRIREIVREGR